jgi:hypothetical protein
MWSASYDRCSSQGSEYRIYRQGRPPPAVARAGARTITFSVLLEHTENYRVHHSLKGGKGASHR